MRGMKKVSNTTFLYDLQCWSRHSTSMGHTVLRSLMASCLRAIITVHALCFAVFLQPSEKRSPRKRQRWLWEEDRGKDKICIQQGYSRSSRWQSHILKRGPRPSISFFTFLLFSKLILHSKKSSQRRRLLDLF